MLDAVIRVLLMCPPPQVGERVVDRVAIYVATDHPSRAGSHEGKQHEAMDPTSTRTVPVQFDGAVPIRAGHVAKNAALSVCEPGARTALLPHHPVQAPHPPLIADFVDADVPGNGSPLFDRGSFVLHEPSNRLVQVGRGVGAPPHHPIMLHCPNRSTCAAGGTSCHWMVFPLPSASRIQAMRRA